jgi:HlyD family secretion protein
MYANAEVVESDLPGVYVGQKAIITGDALARPLDGVVERIGMEVDRNRIVNTDPTAYSDTRIVEVKVRLLDPKRAEKLINAEVRVVFLP